MVNIVEGNGTVEKAQTW